MGAPVRTIFSIVATVEKHGNVIRCCWRLGGRRGGRRETAPFAGPEEGARQLALRAKAYVEYRQGNVTRAEVLREILGEASQAPSGCPTVSEWVKTWALEREPLNPDQPGMDEIQPHTLAGYLSVLELRVLPYIGHYRLDEINEEVLKQWVKDLKNSRVRRSKKRPEGKRISPNTVRRAHETLHQVLGAAVPTHILVNPAARPVGTRKNRLGLPKVIRFEGMYLAPWEVDRIHEHCGPQIQDLWFLLVNTGLRLGEALVLRPQDVTVEGNAPEIRVTRALKKGQWIGSPKSTTSRRIVSVSTALANMLAARCKGKKASALIFLSPRGKMWNEHNLYQRYWLPAVAAAMRCPEHPPPAPPKPKQGPTRALRHDEVSECGCPGILRRRPRLHDGRHTCASDRIHNGWDLMRVQKLLGHESYLTTVTFYGHLRDGSDTAELDEIDKNRGKARGAKRATGPKRAAEVKPAARRRLMRLDELGELEAA